MANSLMLHGVTTVLLMPINHRRASTGKRYAERDIRVHMEDGRDLVITVFSRYGDNQNTVADAIRVVEVGMAT